MKIVLIHLDSRNAKLFDGSFLNKLNELNPKNQAFSDETATLWIKSIVNPKVELTYEQRAILIDKATRWLTEHSDMSGFKMSQPTTKAIRGGHNE